LRIRAASRKDIEARNNVKPQLPDNENDLNPADTSGCSVCRDLLVNLGRFFDMLEAVRNPCKSDWLTVEDVAQELKISKSIVYRLIRNGELEAVDLVVGDEGKLPQKGHFRIRRSALDQFLEGSSGFSVLP
jgi:excisionase family DNA binding protein